MSFRVMRLSALAVAMSTALSVYNVYGLTEKQKLDLRNSIINYESVLKIPESSITAEELNEFLSNLDTYNLSSVKIEGVKNNVLYLSPKYFETPEEMRKVNRFASLVAAESKGVSDKEKVYYIVQRVGSVLKYASNIHDNLKIFSPTAIETGEGVCQAYARLTKIILEKAGIKTQFITGGFAGVNHLWIAVQVDGNWYGVDPTSADLDDGKIDFSYVLMNYQDMKNKGYSIKKTPMITNKDTSGLFRGKGLYSIKDRKIYELYNGNLLTTNFLNNFDISTVESNVDNFYMVGGTPVVKVGESLKTLKGLNLIGNASQDVTCDGVSLKSGNSILYYNTPLSNEYRRLVETDFKVVISKEKDKYTVEYDEATGVTNIYYNDEFLLQVSKFY